MKGSKDEENVTGVVFKLYPFKYFYGCVVQSKGPDPLVVSRLTQFIKDSGLVHFAYRSDKGPAIVAMIEEACARAGRRCTPVTSDNDVMADDVPGIDEVAVQNRRAPTHWSYIRIRLLCRNTVIPENLSPTDELNALCKPWKISSGR